MEHSVDMLLQELREAASCNFISDLPTATTLFNTSARQRILEIPDNRYSSTAWSEAASYIIRKPNSFSTVSEAKKAIVEK